MRYSLIIFFMVCACYGNAQQLATKPRLLLERHGQVSFAALDQFDNIYLVNDGGQIKKLSIKGDSLAIFNQVRNYGAVTSLDVSNPLKVLAFYKQFSTLLILDRFLTVRSSIDLKKFGILQPTAVALSYDNNFWVFDEYDYKLKKVNDLGQLMLQTTDLRNVLSRPISPTRIINENDKVYLLDAAFGVLIFDIYGTLIRKIALPIPDQASINDGLISYIRGNEIFNYHMESFTEKKFAMPPGFSGKNIYFINNKLIVLSDTLLQVFSIEQP